jgi:hypothetical protein
LAPAFDLDDQSFEKLFQSHKVSNIPLHMLPAYSRRRWLTAKFYFIHCSVAQDGFYCGEHMLGSATDTVVNGFLAAATVASVKVQ